MDQREPASAREEEIGYTQSFVAARGFVSVDGFDALLGHDGTKRVFAQLTADPDRPDVRPNDAYLALLHSMQPGWVLRVLQIFWPDALPRTRLYELVEQWPEPGTEGLSILLDGLKLALQQQGIPFTRKTVIEFVYPGPEGAPWWQSLPEMCALHNVQVKYLAQEEVEALAHWILNPSLTG
jgi:hypothetical protein